MGKYNTCPKGSHLIHWTSAVFSHIALKWTPFAYRIFPTYDTYLIVMVFVYVLTKTALTMWDDVLGHTGRIQYLFPMNEIY